MYNTCFRHHARAADSDQAAANGNNGRKGVYELQKKVLLALNYFAVPLADAVSCLMGHSPACR